nr:MAG TPA: hypothetical protein [Caudoviricetes sp.]
MILPIFCRFLLSIFSSCFVLHCITMYAII